MRWPLVRLDECARIVGGATPSTSVPAYWGGDINWVTPKDLSGLKSIHLSGTPRKITRTGLESCAAEVLPPGSVLFSSRAPIGHVAITTAPMATNQGFKSLVPNKRRADAGYLYWWLRCHRTFMESLGNGATFKEVSKAVVSRVEIPLPPLDEQLRIAAILDRAHTLAIANGQALSLARNLEESQFNILVESGSATVHPLPDMYWIQEGPGVRKWQFREHGTKLLNVANIRPDGTLDLSVTSRHLSDEEVASRYSHFLVDAGDLVIASSGIGFDDDGLLRTRGAFVTDRDLPLCMNTSTIRFKPRDGSPGLRYLREWLQSREFREQITRLVTGSAQQNFGPTHLKKLTITVPDGPSLARFEASTQEVTALKEALRRRAERFDTLFASLQHRAFNGQLTRSDERLLEIA